MSEADAMTTRERDVLDAICRSGRGNKEAARELSIAESTLKNHLTRVFRKLGVSDRGGACYRLGRADERKAQQRCTTTAST